MIRLSAPHIDDGDVEAVVRALRSGQLVQAREVEAFESEMRDVIGARHAIAVSNCTSALHLSLLALGVGPGDEVIVPAFSWPATANVVAFIGAKPVFVDIEETSFSMQPEKLRDALKSRRAKAVIPVHPFGEMADMLAITAAAEAAGVPVVEDAACALGSSVNGVLAGRWGVLGCFSFHPRKAITTGEGGVAVTEIDEHARRLSALLNNGLDPLATSADFILPGLNQRMTEFQAALGRAQLKKLDTLLADRRAKATRYVSLLKGSRIATPKPRSSSSHVFQSFVVLVPKEVANRRDEIIRQMRGAGVEVTIGTHHIPLLSFYRQTFGHQAGDFPVTDDVASRAVSLPLHAYLTPDEQETVVHVLRESVGH